MRKQDKASLNLAQELYQLAIERGNQYPITSYENRWYFDQKLEELAYLAIKESDNIEINEKILPICEIFRKNPVFICGYYKSGTSLLNSLFDYHPEVVSLLPDSRILMRVKEKADNLTKENYFLYLAKNYVTRLYNPTGHFPMNLYSDNSEELNIEKYASFVAYFKYFIQRARSKSDLLSALPCAVFMTNGQFQKGHQPKIWVEKTPTNEYYIELAKKLFPNSIFIYIARNPYDNLASIRRWYTNSGREELSNIYRFFSQFKESLTKAIKMRTQDDFYLIKYEDLAFNPENEMRNVSKFLDITYYDSLTTPTIMGIPDRANISDVNDENRNVTGRILKSPVGKYKKSLTKRELTDITIEFSGLMKSLGYKPKEISSFYKLYRYVLLNTKIIFRIFKRKLWP